jgi:ComF family protein
LRFNGLRIAGAYQEPLRSYIHMFKYRDKKRLGDPLGALLAQTYSTYRMQADCLIPVPLHPQREQERGYNQAQILAQVCATRLHLPVYTTLLHRVRLTHAQAHLSLQDRQHNVLDAFQCDQTYATRILTNRRIIIVDDVCTTSSTLAACAAPLFLAGAREVWGLVLARPI